MSYPSVYCAESRIGRLRQQPSMVQIQRAPARPKGRPQNADHVIAHRAFRTQTFFGNFDTEDRVPSTSRLRTEIVIACPCDRLTFKFWNPSLILSFPADLLDNVERIAGAKRLFEPAT